jgi:hypothetical protein
MSGREEAIEKMRADGASDVAVDTFAHYFERLRAGDAGVLAEAEIEPVAELPDADELPADEDGARAALDDGALNEVRVLEHQGDDFVVGEFALAQTQLAVDGLARPQEVARRELHLAEQLAQLPLVERGRVVVHLLEGDAALTEQPVNLTTLRSSRLLVNSNLVGHRFSGETYGKMPRTRVASATRSTARM